MLKRLVPTFLKSRKLVGEGRYICLYIIDKRQVFSIQSMLLTYIKFLPLAVYYGLETSVETSLFQKETYV